MRLLVTTLLALLGAVGLALLARRDPGYVLIARSDWTLETSLTLAVIVVLATFTTLYFSLRALINTWQLPRRMATWRQLRRQMKARRATHRGLIDLAEGHWAEAEHHLTKYAEFSDTPLLNYLTAARAAQQQGADQRRDHYLSLAHRSMPEAELAVGLTQAEVQLSHGQLEQALATLMHLRTVAPRHTHVLYLLKRLYQRLKDWGQLKALLPDLRRNKVLGEEALQKLEKDVQLESLKQASSSRSALHDVWQALPKHLRQDTDLSYLYAQGLVHLGDDEEAERLLRETLKRRWQVELVHLYGRIHSADPARQLYNAEAWLRQHERDPLLLLTLGRLCLRNALWGKARSYLEASLGIERSAETLRELGVLLEQLGEVDSARALYREGLERSIGAEACTSIEIETSSTNELVAVSQAQH